MNTSNQDRIYKIYNAIKQLGDTGNIYEILRTMDIPKTMNSNGIFVNLKCLREDQINILYDIVQSIKCPQIPEQSLQSYQPISSDSKSQAKVKYKKPRLTKLQKEILSVTI